MALFPTAICLNLMISCSGQIVEEGLSPEFKATRVLDDMIDGGDTPGLQYIMLSRDIILFEYNSGLSSLPDSTPVSAATTFNAFSVTKTFTALAVLQLLEKGMLVLDDTVQYYLKDLPYDAPITIRQLLNHTSGVPNPMPLKWVHLVDEHAGFNYDEFVNRLIRENNKLDDNPGEHYAYSNIGYLILGKLIASVSGIDYRSYVRTQIIDLLPLKDDASLDFKISDTLVHARGYIKTWSFLNFGLNFLFDKSKFMDDSYQGWTQFKHFYMDGYSFGGLIGNAQGFAIYLKTLLGDNYLIRDEIKQELFETQYTRDGKLIDMCLGWFRGKLGDTIYFTHAGGGGGYYCEIRLYPEKKLASVIMFNKTGVSDKRILDEVDVFFLE